jgi:DNA repair protein RadD
MKTLRPYQQEIVDILKKRLKETEHPLLVNASVGAGKSLIIASLLQIIEKAGWRALCLTMNSTLIRQNAETYIDQGGHAGIYCAALGMKNTSEPIIFASPMSVRGSIKRNGKLSKIPFNLIIIDECHNVNFKDKKTTYMRIFHHYSIYAQTLGHKLRFIGLTGTPYRGKGYTIVDEKLFFKEEVCAITADWLIQENYLTMPVWGYSEKSLQYDFKKLKINSLGKFNAIELSEAVDKQPRLTGKIMAEVIEIVKNRKGAFIFASSVKHCQECAEWLPKDETAIITGDTPDKLREQYITQAKAGTIKYLVNVNVLCTGVDVPNFDTVVFVRPTESLVLYIQCLGRGLRLADGKTDCLILDYAGNLERHGDIDNPIINKALQPKNLDDPDYCIECFDCNTMNTLMARRCIGNKNDKRCEHWFEWKDCIYCGTKNDIVSRQCRSCKGELIDPNRNLKNIASNQQKFIFDVCETEYLLSLSAAGYPYFIIRYSIKNEFGDNTTKKIQENFSLASEKGKNFFYHAIVKKHFKSTYDVYNNLSDLEFLKNIIQTGELYSPVKIECVIASNEKFKIIKKHFVYNT